MNNLISLKEASQAYGVSEDYLDYLFKNGLILGEMDDNNQIFFDRADAASKLANVNTARNTSKASSASKASFVFPKLLTSRAVLALPALALVLLAVFYVLPQESGPRVLAAYDDGSRSYFSDVVLPIFYDCQKYWWAYVPLSLIALFDILRLYFKKRKLEKM